MIYVCCYHKFGKKYQLDISMVSRIDFYPLFLASSLISEAIAYQSQVLRRRFGLLGLGWLRSLSFVICEACLFQTCSAGDRTMMRGVATVCRSGDEMMIPGGRRERWPPSLCASKS